MQKSNSPATLPNEIHLQSISQPNNSFDRQLLAGMPVACYTCDKDGYITYFNAAAAELWGRNPILGKDQWCGSWKIYDLSGNQLALDTLPMGLALQKGISIFGSEIIIETPEGLRRNVLPHPQPIFDSEGGVIGGYNILIDITERKKAEKAVRESKERFRTVADTVPAMIWMSGSKKERIFFNKAWTNYTGRKLEQELGDGWLENLHPDHRERILNLYNESFDARKIYSAQYLMRRADGEYRWISAIGNPRYALDGNFLGYTGACIDITEEKLASQVLEQKIVERTTEIFTMTDQLKATNAILEIKNQELERSNDELEQFAHIASHDLQEPLRKIQMFAGRLQEEIATSINQQVLTYVEKINQSSQRMSNLIKDVLDYSSLHQKGLSTKKTDLNTIVKEVINDFDLIIEEKNAVIEYTTLPVLKGVPLQMSQLFGNLLSNSLKYAKKGVAPHIHISSIPVTQEEIKTYSLPNGTYSKITITDNGVGFEQEYAEKIFIAFQRLHGKQEFDGTGIGLALCRKIVDLHKGVIYATSKPGAGASFHLILPTIPDNIQKPK